MLNGFRYVVLLLAAALPAHAAVLTVGPDQKYKLPSEAIAAAAPGDTIQIKPGNYKDCAAWNKDNLTIEGLGEGPVLAGAICQGTGIFVVNALNAVIRNITFAGATVDEGNGSGIRANGQKLLVENCTFRHNQDGILTTNNGTGTILVRKSTFEGNGACLPNKGCAHGIYVGHIALARIEQSRFFNSKFGHHIKSRAKRTEVVDNTIEDGPEGSSSYLVDVPNGGAFLMTGNKLEKGPNTQNPTAAVSIGEEGGGRPADEVIISGNTFRNDGPHTLFVRNVTTSKAQLSGNVIKGPASVLSGPGSAN